MKILIADNSKTIRLRLGFLLSDLEDVEIIEVTSGVEALKMMTGDNPPQIALLAWMIQDLSGIEVCKQVRKENFRGDGLSISPYIILMTSKSRVEDIAEGLNAGADDYIQKPWDDIEFKARIHVATRSVALQNELQRRYAEVESLLRRYEVAHNVIAKGHRRDSRVSYVDVPGTTTKGASLVSAQDGLLSVERHLVAAFGKIGCGEVLSTMWDGTHPTANPHVVWTASVLDDVGIWLDFLVQIDQESLEYLHNAIGGEGTANKSYLSETLKGIVEIAQNEVRYALSKQSLNAWALGAPTILTSHSNKLPPTDNDCAEHIQIQVGEADIYFTVSDVESPVIEANLRQLERFQVLVEDFCSPWKKDIPILKKGTSIRQSHLSKLYDLSRDEHQSFLLNVMNPSPLGELAAKVSSISNGSY